MKSLLIALLSVASIAAVPCTNICPVPVALGPVIPGMNTALEKALASDQDTVVVNINSPGGYVSELYRLEELTNAYRAKGGHVVCRVTGMAASAAAVYFESVCDERIMTKGSSLMFHEIADEVSGKGSDIQKKADEIYDEEMRQASIYAYKLGMTAEEYIAWIRARNRWLDASLALKMGATDSVE